MSRPSIRETISAARARLAQEQAKSKSIRGGAEDERQAFVSSGIPGPRSRTTAADKRQTDVEILGHVQKSIKSLIANAKGTGIMNLSSRELTEIPQEIWNMYTVDPDKVVVDFNSSSTAWYDAVDLTRLNAADNKITFIGPRIQEFGALVAIDLRSNDLTDLPDEFGELGRLATLNLSSNKFTEIPAILFKLTSLLDLQLANNQLSGAVDPTLGRLSKLEALDLSGNQLTDLPQELSQLKAVRKLSLAKNKFQSLPIGILAAMTKLSELEVGDNNLQCLFSGLGECASEEGIEFATLVRLDARNSGIECITDIEAGVDDSAKPRIGLPVIKELQLSHNSLQHLEHLLYATPLLRLLDLRSNHFTQIPVGVLELENLRHLDLANNRMEHMPAELGSMIDLTTFVWEGNPIRNVPRTATTTDALMKLLRQRQELDFPSTSDTARIEALAVSPARPSSQGATFSKPMTPSRQGGPTAGRSPSVSQRSSAALATASSPPPSPKKPSRASQNLNLAKKALTDLSQEQILEACSDPQMAVLDFNALTKFPVALQETFGGTTLTQISIHHNRITVFPFDLDFPLLISLDISDNVIPSLEPTDTEVEEIGKRFPSLTELNLTANKLTALPAKLSKMFPKLTTFRASRNRIAVIEPSSFEGVQVLDLTGNEIATLPPLLGNVRSLRNLMLDGNLFRVPRRQVMEQGTEVVMEYLRGRIPV